jgi:hypothetical protein
MHDITVETSTRTAGRVSGTLERVDVHETHEFVLFPPIEGVSISCQFGPELLDDVRRAIKRHVTVSGFMDYLPGSPFPRYVRVTSIEIHPSDEELPGLADLRGMARGCTDGMTAVEFVRSIRDE